MLNLSSHYLRAGLWALLFLVWGYFGWRGQAWSGFVLLPALFGFLREIRNIPLIASILYSYTFLFLFNFFALYWGLTSSYSHLAYFAFTFNAFLMLLPVLFWLIGTKYLKFKLYHFIFCWLGFEYLHYNWDLAYPWLTFGASLGNYSAFIQYYEWTGVFGGSLWLLLAGYFLHEAFYTKKFKQLILGGVTIFIPLVFSLILYHFDNRTFGNEKYKPVQVALFHSNFTADSIKKSNLEHLKSILMDLKKDLDLQKNTFPDYVLMPEYTLKFPVQLAHLKQSPEVLLGRQFLKDYPKMTILLGLELQEKGFQNKKYNTVIELNHLGLKSIYIRSRHIPFQEIVPKGFSFLHFPSENYTTQAVYLKDFEHRNKNFLPVLAICYESIFSNHLRSQNQKFQDLGKAIFMFSNESFFRASFGIEQYYHHIKSQAITFRKAVARSSNKGYSTVINCKGKTKALKKYSDKGFIKTSFNVNNYQTFYSRYGDFIGYLSLIYVLTIILILFRKKIIKK